MVLGVGKKAIEFNPSISLFVELGQGPFGKNRFLSVSCSMASPPKVINIIDRPLPTTKREV